MTSLTIIGKPDCHLCDVAEGVVEQVLADLPDDVADRVEVAHASILDDPALYEQWWEKIPVVLVDGRLHAHWRVAAERLRGALMEAADAASVTHVDVQADVDAQADIDAQAGADAQEVRL